MLKKFKGEDIHFVETMDVKLGVTCDVYIYEKTNSKDLGIISVKTGYFTPKQKVLKGDKTIEGYLSGKGTLKVNDKIYNFPNDDYQTVDINVGDLVQWESLDNLEFYEICYPPYEDGRFENIDLNDKY